jgi:hypothetical protein
MILQIILNKYYNFFIHSMYFYDFHTFMNVIIIVLVTFNVCDDVGLSNIQLPLLMKIGRIHRNICLFDSINGNNLVK